MALLYNVCIYKQINIYLYIIISIMKKSKTPLLPSQEKIMKAVGENIKLARLRRDFSMEQVAERAGVGRITLGKVEHGDSGVAMGTYLKVLFVLGLENDMMLLAQDDMLGRKLQDAKLITKERATKRKTENGK